MRRFNFDRSRDDWKLVKGDGNEDFHVIHEFGERDERLIVGEQFVGNAGCMWEVVLVLSGRIRDLKEMRISDYTSTNMDKKIDKSVICQNFLYKTSVDQNTIGTVTVVKYLGKR